jgi:hypothetical protein
MARVTRPDSHRADLRRRVLGCWLAAAVVLAGCGSSTQSASPQVSRSATPVSSVAPSSVTPNASSATSQTDTAWGRIWDSLPAGFPAITGSTPAEAPAGAASATLVVQGDVAKTVATTMKTALEGAGFRTEGLSGPLEDGTYVLDAVGNVAACRVQVTASPLGGVTTVTVMYAAACPHG